MKLLFICTHNRCRSIIAEAVTNQYGNGILSARSAGTQPSGQIHPLCIKYLEAAGIDTSGLQSQSWDEYEAWMPDVVITVCDQAAKEQCPIWHGDTLTAHWGLPDPSRLEVSEQQIADAFKRTITTLKSRIQELSSANLQALDDAELLALLNTLGNR